jgi:hypothetical protein
MGDRRRGARRAMCPGDPARDVLVLATSGTNRFGQRDTPRKIPAVEVASFPAFRKQPAWRHADKLTIADQSGGLLSDASK